MDHTALNENKQPKKWKEACFIFGITSISLLSGFSYAIGSTRKSDPEMFDKGLMKVRNLHAAGSSLALKALGWGTLYAVGGVALFSTLVWKLSGAKNLQEFRMKAGNILPKIPKNDPPQGRTEFKSLTDFLQYLIDEDARNKNVKENEVSQLEKSNM
ncbi:Transmembrane protein [Armadillidium nasatum]|uniref:Transmembrane protein 242 n=1 Tax=Armadillidium nasatum TaxID=96803 RepID=A0A5N5SQX0_9CRUS|nr:Transmembrane protein [Armadillidium nasatum]